MRTDRQKFFSPDRVVVLFGDHEAVKRERFPIGSRSLIAGIVQSVYRHGLSRPGDIALVLPHRVVNWAELSRAAQRLANGLVNAGATQNRTVALLVTEFVDAVELFLAIMQIGGTIAPVPRHLGQESIDALLENCDPSVIVVDGTTCSLVGQRFGPRVVEIAQLRDGPPCRVSAVGNPDGDLSLLYSSGTTSAPKAVVHTYKARMAAARRDSAFWGLAPHKTVLLATPFYTGMTWSLLMPSLLSGARIVVIEQFIPSEVLKTIKKENPHVTKLVPTQYSMLLEAPNYARKIMAPFEKLIYGGAKVDHRLRMALRTLFPGRAYEVYGSTETQSISCLGPAVPVTKVESVGRPFSGVGVAILDEAGVAAAAGHGEICVNGPFLMRGYQCQQREAQHCFVKVDGTSYYRTGDRGIVDADGYIWVEGRSSDVIISAGLNIHASDIEGVLLQHGSVREAAVVPRPHQVLGQTPFAYVVLHPGSIGSPRELCTWANQRLNQTQKIYDLKVLEQLPRNPSGKVDKERLRSDRT